MSGSWTCYLTRWNEMPASVLVDLGILDSVPDHARPWLLWMRIYLRQSRADGLWNSEEGEILEKIEESVLKTVEGVAGAECVGHVTTAGRREVCFYGARPTGFDEAVERALKDFPDYEVETGAREDPEWSHYLDVLVPSPEEFERIRNMHLVDCLREHGDPLTAPRPVSHWAFFKSKEDRARFVAEAAARGFTLVNEYEIGDSEGERPYAAALERVDRVDWDSINGVTLDLFRLAKQVDGEYDGWETSVEKAG